MSYKKFYEKQSSAFQMYVRNTNQKDILVKKIVEKLESSFKFKKNQEFIFTDIGAGDGTVTIPIVNYLKGRTKLICNVIEPSDMIESIKVESDFENNYYMKKKIDEVIIPKSDFILISHVLVYLDGHMKTVKRICSSLKEGGIALIVETNQKSGDILLKIKLGKDYALRKHLNLMNNLLNFLNVNKVEHKLEIIESEINVSSCSTLNKDGKAIISFFYHTPFGELSKKDIKGIQIAIKELSGKNHRLVKKEDYLWIHKRPVST